LQLDANLGEIEAIYMKVLVQRCRRRDLTRWYAQMVGPRSLHLLENIRDFEGVHLGIPFRQNCTKRSGVNRAMSW
jgi:hypothetical protein